MSDNKTKTKTKNKNKNKNKLKSFVIRDVTNYTLDIIKKSGIKNSVIGFYYIFFHSIIIFLVGFTLLFTININHLIILLIIVSLDAFSVVVLHGCPLTILEQKYLGTNGCDERTNSFKQMGIFYTCRHEYEKQIELLINVWTLIAGKCLSLLLFKLFNLKLKNYNNLYK